MIRWKSGSLFKPHGAFFREHPALLLAISFLFGSSGALYPMSSIFPALWLLYLACVEKNLLFRGAIFLALGYSYSFFSYAEAPHPKEPLAIEGIFSPSSLQPHQSPFQRGLLYKGTLWMPEPIPCSFCLQGENRPEANRDFLIKGLLQERNPYQYTIKIQKWQTIPSSAIRFAEMRYRCKESVRAYLQSHLSTKSASFLASLITGDVEDRTLRFEFGKVGLQHLLAISGFHFAILIGIAAQVFSLFLPQKTKYGALLFVISLYFLFVGSAPAVLRSFCAASLYLIGKLLNRHPIALNLLGCAMLFELILDPLAPGQISFQLSFISCLSLLLLSSPIDHLLQTLLPKRTSLELSQMTPLSPLGYLISTLIRKSLSLTFAVTLALLPTILFHFHKFPMLGLFYNLFIPLGVTAALYLLAMSLIFPFLFRLTDAWTTQLLELISYPPLPLDYSLRLADIPSWACILYLFFFFLFAIHTKSTRTESLLRTI